MSFEHPLFNPVVRNEVPLGADVAQLGLTGEIRDDEERDPFTTIYGEAYEAAARGVTGFTISQPDRSVAVEGASMRTEDIVFGAISDARVAAQAANRLEIDLATREGRTPQLTREAPPPYLVIEAPTPSKLADTVDSTAALMRSAEERVPDHYSSLAKISLPEQSIASKAATVLWKRTGEVVVGYVNAHKLRLAVTATAAVTALGTHYMDRIAEPAAEFCTVSMEDQPLGWFEGPIRDLLCNATLPDAENPEYRPSGPIHDEQQRAPDPNDPIDPEDLGAQRHYDDDPFCNRGCGDPTARN